LINIDALLATPLVHEWGKAQALAVAAPLATLPHAPAGIAAALGAWDAHEGRRWHVCGAVGGVMRKIGFTRDQCEATIREWLGDAPPARVNVAAGVKQALGAYAKPEETVSGFSALAELIGEQHARLVEGAAIAARYPRDRGGDAFSPADLSVDADGMPTLAFDVTRQGTPRPTHVNVLRALESWLGDRIRYEEHAGRIVCTGIDESLGRFPDGQWSDVHTTALVALCEQQRLDVAPSAVDRAVALHARYGAYNVLTEFVLECATKWDGTPRVDAALTTYWRAEDTPATRAVSRVFLLSLVARGLEPGAKVDTCPQFIGDQGVGKSRSFRALVGGPWFADSPLPIGDKDGMQNLRGTWLWEFGENESLGRREMNAVKAFLSSREDKFRASYGHHTETVPRQTCFVVSTNNEEILRDPTGERRFLPVHVGAVDVAGIERDREQLIGEAVCRVGAGEKWWLTPDEELALAPVREAATEVDPWEAPIAAWLHARRVPSDVGACLVVARPGESEAEAAARWEALLTEGDEGPPFTLDDVMHWAPATRGGDGEVIENSTGAVPIETSRRGKKEQARIASILRRLGYERTRDWSRGPTRGAWLWARG